MEPTELSERLQRLADRTAPPSREDLAGIVAVRHRTERRQRLVTGLVAAGVAAVVVAVPLLGDRAPTVTAAPLHPAGPSAGLPDVAPGADVLSGPTRGSLAGDTAFVEAVRRLSWTEADNPDVPTAEADPPLESRHVVFAGDVPGGRWALVAGQDTAGARGSAVLWFVGPAGAAPDRLQPAMLSAGLEPGSPVALTDAGTGTLVVVAAPGDEVEVSQGPDVAADGTVSRTWEAADAPDGVAVVALPPAARTYDEGLRYRVTRGGTEVVTALPPGFRASVAGYTPPAISITWPGGPPDDRAADRVLTEIADEVLTRTGLSQDDVPFTVVWGGDLPAPDDRVVHVHLLTATLPSGATYTEARLSRETGGRVVAGAWCGSQLRPAGPPPAGQTFAVRCDVTDGDAGSGEVSSLVVVAPAPAVQARVVGPDGRILAEVALSGGAAVVPAPDGAAGVRTLDASGDVLDEQPLMGFVDLSRK